MTRPSSSATTRLRSAVTTSASWVAMSTVTPSSLMRSSSWMISQLMSGSRLPVGSSAMIDPRVVDERAGDRRPLLLAARELRGELARLAGQADERQHAIDRGPDLAARRAVTSSAKAMFSQTVLVGRSLKSWNTMPILRRTCGTFRRGSRARSSPSSDDLPCVASSSRMSSFMSVDLPAPDGADEEHEVALGHDQVHVLEGDLAVRIASW